MRNSKGTNEARKPCNCENSPAWPALLVAVDSVVKLPVVCSDVPPQFSPWALSSVS